MRGFRVLGALAAVMLWAVPARAIPVFAHRYGLTCQACHTTVPHLTAFGRDFAARGFRLAQAARGTIPIAVKVNLAYASRADEHLPKTIVDEIELLSGGAIGKNFSYFAEQYAVDGGVPGNTRDAWLQSNAGAVRIRAGRFTAPLPTDPETQRETLAHYLVFDQTIASNTFKLFDPLTGVEVEVGEPSHIGGHVAVLMHHALFGSAYALINNDVILGAYRYQAHPSRGGAFYRQGVSVEHVTGKLDVLALLAHGGDGGTPSSGGFVQTRYAFSPALVALARYDAIGDPSAGSERQTVLSVAFRVGPNMRFTVEDRIAHGNTLNAGLLFAY